MTRSRRFRPFVWAVLILGVAAAVHFWNAQLESERIPRITAQMETFVRDLSSRRDQAGTMVRADSRIRDSLRRILEERIPEDSVTTASSIRSDVTPLKNTNDRATHAVELLIDDIAIINLRITWIDEQDQFTIIGYEIPQPDSAAESDDAA